MSTTAPGPSLNTEILDSLRELRERVRARPGLLAEAVERMQGLGCEVTRIAGGDDAVVARVLEIVPQGAEAVYHPCVVGRAVGLAEALRQAGRRVIILPSDVATPDQPPLADGNGSWRDHFLSAPFGITGANAVVAETGTLALAEDGGFGRAASNIPPAHIALVTSDSIVEHLLDAAVVARGYAALHLHTPVPRYLSLITGPSRTADIGLTLVRGMHGPKAVHVLIWDRPKAEGRDDAALRAWVLP